MPYLSFALRLTPEPHDTPSSAVRRRLFHLSLPHGLRSRRRACTHAVINTAPYGCWFKSDAFCAPAFLYDVSRFTTVHIYIIPIRSSYFRYLFYYMVDTRPAYSAFFPSSRPTLYHGLSRHVFGNYARRTTLQYNGIHRTSDLRSGINEKRKR